MVAASLFQHFPKSCLPVSQAFFSFKRSPASLLHSEAGGEYLKSLGLDGPILAPADLGAAIQASVQSPSSAVSHRCNSVLRNGSREV